jgi:arabinogalactan endo-1,4-beta-galactosidase
MRFHVTLIFLICVSACGDESKPTPPQPPVELAIRGADVSFLPEIEAYPTTFYYKDGVAKDVLDMLKANGCNAIRVRLWHTPPTEHSGLEEVTEFAARIRAKGMKVWLTVHYSDSWADPGQQTKPAAWSTLDFIDLSDSVYNYTKKIVTRLQPDIIQIGNEINDGLLWPDGKISESLSNFITLLKEGVQAVRDHAPTTKIMVHYAGPSAAQWFYQQLQNENVSYDMIGLSYYPWWHGKDLVALQTTLNSFGFMFGKEIVIAETAYPFTLGWNDFTNNFVGLEDHLIPGYPATEAGQKKFLLKLKQVIAQSEKGTGFCYWAPEWVAFKGTTATDGSAAENLALFNFSNQALSAFEAFE